jgi:hypothetical protein
VVLGEHSMGSREGLWPVCNTRPGLAALRQGLVGRFAPGRKNVVSGECTGSSVWDADVSSLAPD